MYMLERASGTSIKIKTYLTRRYIFLAHGIYKHLFVLCCIRYLPVENGFIYMYGWIELHI